MRWLGPDALAVCRAHRGLPVGFLLLRYSVLFTVESLSLLYLLAISWFICFRRWCIDKLGVFHANQISMCLDAHLNGLSCVCYVFVCVCLYVLCGHLLGKGWPLGSRLWCLTVSLSLSHLYPGSGVVLDCIDFWSLHPYVLGIQRLSNLLLLRCFLINAFRIKLDHAVKSVKVNLGPLVRQAL